MRTRLSSLRLSPTREAEIVDELSQHLDDRYRELIAGGASPEEATRLALADFRSGNVLAQQMASLRQAHAPAPVTPGAPTGHVLSDLWQDLRYATRTFWKQPAFAAATVLTLALGIGATTAIFSVVYGVLLKPLPFQEPETAGEPCVNTRRTGQERIMAPPPISPIARTRGRSRRSAPGIPPRSPLPEAAIRNVSRHCLVSAATLPLLRVQPVLGRVFSAEDDTPGNPLRVVLTHGYWQRRFGGAANVVGQSLVDRWQAG